MNNAQPKLQIVLPLTSLVKLLFVLRALFDIVHRGVLHLVSRCYNYTRTLLQGLRVNSRCLRHLKPSFQSSPRRTVTQPHNF